MEEHAVVGLFGEALVSNRCNTYHTVWEAVAIIIISDESGLVFCCCIYRKMFWVGGYGRQSVGQRNCNVELQDSFSLKVKNRTVGI